MATGYDGTIRINTKIDEKGFNRGVSSLVKALKPLGAALAVFFGVGQIVRFGKTAVSEASKMSTAFIGLQSIVEGTGNSFSQAQDFLNEFTEDGLVPMNNAVTAYKNLLARGYDTNQIEQTLVRLKDAASFGRQASLTLGNAVQSATEGLKNENSILVDNAGVTRNVSKMWEDYAKSIGTTVSALTKEQKIQAEVNGIMNETRFQVGDAAKLSGTYAGQISALSVSVLNLKVAFGNVLIPIIQTFLPIIKSAIDALTIFFNRLARIVGILFGVNIGEARDSMQQMGDATQGAADAQGNLADNTEEAGKAAKGALASFDDLNVLAQDTGSGASAPSDVGGGGGVGLGDLDTETLDTGLDEMTDKVMAWKEAFLGFIEPVRSYIVDELAPVLGEVFGNAWEVFLAVWDSVSPYLKEILIALVPVARIIGDVIIIALQWLADYLLRLSVYIRENEQEWGLIVTTLLIVGGIITGLIFSGISALIGIIVGLGYVLANAGRAFDMWKDIMLLGIEIMRKAFGIAFSVIGNVIIKTFNNARNIVKGIVNSIIDIINGMIGGVVSGINTIIGAANTVGSILPGYSGIGLVATPQIPHLATGAVIPPNAEFLAVMGDQTSGRNIEAPEGLIRQIINEEMGNIEADIKVSFEGTLAQLVRELKPKIDAENVRIGKSLISGGMA